MMSLPIISGLIRLAVYRCYNPHEVIKWKVRYTIVLTSFIAINIFWYVMIIKNIEKYRVRPDIACYVL